MDRLMAILISLQQRPETAQSLADKFEVSKRTILRDMQSLSEMGIPIYSTTGPMGGFRLMDGFQLSPLQFSSQEALIILMALQAFTKMTDTPFNKERWTVIDKIRSSLPQHTLKQIEPILERTEIEVPHRNFKVPNLSKLMDYTANAKWLNVFYRSQNHRRWLRIFPKRVYTSNGFWYCEAYSSTHGEERVFRVDRMDQLEVTEPPVEEKAIPFLNIDDESKNQSVRVKAKLTYRGMLQVEQDMHIGECIYAITDEEWVVDFLCPAAEWSWAVRFFFSLGLDAEVLEPESLRKEIYDLADQMCRRYGTT
jgi:predicted DNA-binding transcriptional regulator YafY